jgi:hypothetical protein
MGGGLAGAGTAAVMGAQRWWGSSNVTMIPLQFNPQLLGQICDSWLLVCYFFTSTSSTCAFCLGKINLGAAAKLGFRVELVAEQHNPLRSVAADAAVPAPQPNKCLPSVFLEPIKRMP